MPRQSTKGAVEKTAPVEKKPNKAELAKAEKAQQKLDENADIIRAAVQSMGLRSVDPKDIKGVSTRIGWYFDQCADRGAKPSLPGLANALGISKHEWQRWASGAEGNALAYIAGRTMVALEAIWAELSLAGISPPAASIFGAKNWYGYSDTPPQAAPITDTGDYDLDSLAEEARLLPEYTITVDAEDSKIPVDKVVKED